MAQVKETREARVRLQKLQKRSKANAICVDCDKVRPNWASVTIGCFLCTDCAAIHRGLGTHLSFVRSVSLDEWTLGQVERMEAWGNENVKRYFEAKIPLGYLKPPEKNATNQQKTKWIKDKYETCRFVEPHKRGRGDPRNGGLPNDEPPPVGAEAEAGGDEEDADVAEAIRRSLADAAPPPPAATHDASSDLLSFEAPPPPPSVPRPSLLDDPAPPQQQPGFAAFPPPQHVGAPPPQSQNDSIMAMFHRRPAAMPMMAPQPVMLPYSRMMPGVPYGSPPTSPSAAQAHRAYPARTGPASPRPTLAFASPDRSPQPGFGFGFPGSPKSPAPGSF